MSCYYKLLSFKMAAKLFWGDSHIFFEHSAEVTAAAKPKLFLYHMDGNVGIHQKRLRLPDPAVYHVLHG